MTQRLFMGILGFFLFGMFFYQEFLLFIGFPVRKWLRGDIDYDALEASYKNAKFLKDAIVRMLAGGRVAINTERFQKCLYQMQKSAGNFVMQLWGSSGRMS